MVTRFLAWFDAFLEEFVHGDRQQVVIDHTVELITKPIPMSQTKATLLYEASKGQLGAHLSLNEAVPWMVGCAEAVSCVLQRFGISGIPKKGIEGTAALLAFLRESPQFEEIYTYTPGAIIISATGTGNGKIRGHVGVCGYNAIMSNNSETGKWDTQWDIVRWEAYYTSYGGIPTRFFLPV